MTINNDKLYADVQTLEPGARIELFELDAAAITGVSVNNNLYFHGYTQVGPITWQGQEYGPWPIRADGLVLDPSKPARPTLTVGNVDGSITALVLAYEDLVGAKVLRHRTLGKYLDAVNFGGTNPDADPDQEWPVDMWFIDQKTSETHEMVQFALASAMNIGGVRLPLRMITQKDFPAAGLMR